MSMPSKHKPRSVRLGPDRDQWLEEFAGERGCTPHAAMIILFDMAVNQVAVKRAQRVLAQAERQAAHLAQPAQKPRSRWAV